MDLVMPGMDGFAATKAIRALPRVDALTIPIIAVTANTYQDVEDEVHAAGMNACQAGSCKSPDRCARAVQAVRVLVTSD